MLDLPDVYLKKKKWKPMNPEAKPRDTDWIDPLTKSKQTLIDALRIQWKRDEEEMPHE